MKHKYVSIRVCSAVMSMCTTAHRTVICAFILMSLYGRRVRMSMLLLFFLPFGSAYCTKEHIVDMLGFPKCDYRREISSKYDQQFMHMLYCQSKTVIALLLFRMRNIIMSLHVHTYICLCHGVVVIILYNTQMYACKLYVCTQFLMKTLNISTMFSPAFYCSYVNEADKP